MPYTLTVTYYTDPDIGTVRLECRNHAQARRRAMRYAKATARDLGLHLRIDKGYRCHVYDPETGEIAVSYIPTPRESPAADDNPERTDP